MTIYLPDDLAESVKQHTDLNVSAVCQAALREELATREALAKLESGMERVEVYDSNRERNVSFVGRRLAYGEKRDWTAYLTKHHRIAVYDGDASQLGVYEDFDEFASAWGEPGGSGEEPHHGTFVTDVAEALGQDYVIHLDI